MILGLSFDDEIFFPMSTVVLENYNSLGIAFGSCFVRSILDFFPMVAARMILLSVFVPTATFSTMVIRILDFPAMSTRMVGCYSLPY
jgi:hypothetical protein